MPDTSDISDRSDASTADAQTCSANAECTEAHSVCDPMSQLCVDCLYDNQCPGDGRCIERTCKTEGTCEADSECVNVTGKPSCNTAIRECVASCNTSLDCAQGTICDPAQNACVQCASNLDCDDNQRCIATQCEDYIACQSDYQCTPHGLLCDKTQGACNECENDNACPDAYFCTEGRCIIGVCNDGDTRCTNQNVQTCTDGQWSEIAQSCLVQEACIQNNNHATCGSCTADSQCRYNYNCDANSGQCVRCTSDVDCENNQPEIFTTRSIRFERVNPGSPESQIITVQNLGYVPLNIENIVLTGHEAFTLSYPNPSQVADDQPPLPELDAWPSVLEPNASFPVRIRFTPRNNQPVTSELVLFTNDPITKHSPSISSETAIPHVWS